MQQMYLQSNYFSYIIMKMKGSFNHLHKTYHI